MVLLQVGGKKVNLNEECLIQYLINAGNSQKFILQSDFKYENLNSPEYNEITWFFI